MMKEVEKLMKGSVHEDNLFIVHYDLVLMKAKEYNYMDGREKQITLLVPSQSKTKWLKTQ